MKIVITFLIYIFFLSNTAFAQKLGNVWYFGKFAGITFNTPDGKPIAITNNRLQIWEGCATVSDVLGNIAFYTDGMNVINKNHDWMYINQTYRQYTLNGGSSSSQSAIIVPFPGDSLRFYIFTTEAYENRQTSRGFNYSVVDMRAYDGTGNIFPYNVNLLSSSLEKVTAIKSQSNDSYWVITHSYDTDIFYSFLVDSSGIQPPVLSYVSPVIGNVDFAGDQGYLKASSDGRYLAAAYTQLKDVYLYDFNNQTGVVSNPRSLFPANPMSFYGVEFSPDVSKLYVSFFGLQKGIYQLDITQNNIQDIRNTALLILDEQGFPPGAMQLGPDGRIYVAKDVSSYLDVINSPNRRYPDCNLQRNAVFLDVDNTGRRSQLGLPNSTTSIYFVRVTAHATYPACDGDTVYLSANVDASTEGYSVRWTGPNGFISFSKDTSINKINKSASGWYYVEVILNEKTAKDSVYIEITDSPYTDIVPDGDVVFCAGDSLRLRAVPFNPSFSYTWSTGETTESIVVRNTGRYFLFVTNNNDCNYLDSIDIVVIDKPKFNIIPLSSPEFCQGDSVILEIVPYETDINYTWSTGETGRFITVKESGVYTVVGINSNNCIDSTSQNVSVFPLPVAAILEGEHVQICKGDSIVLNAEPENMYYLWSTGETSQSIVVRDEGNYFVVVSNENQCFDTAFCRVQHFEHTPVKIMGIQDICMGDSTVLSLSSDYAFQYWSTGETKKEIIVRETGWISVIAWDENGCSSTDSIYISVFRLSVFHDAVKQIDFNRVFIDSIARLSVSIVNMDASEFVIESITFSSNNNFSHNNILPATVSPGEEYYINLEFKPDDIIRYNDSIFININYPCPLVLSGSISGTGIVTFVAILPDTVAEIGNKDFCINIYGYFETAKNISDSSGFTMSISNLSDVFYPNNLDYTFNLDYVTATINSQTRVTTDLNIIDYYCGLVMLGENDYSPLKFESIVYHNPNIIVKSIDGSIRTEGICAKNLSKIMSLQRNSVELKSNIITDELNFDLTIKNPDNILIELYDYTGRLIEPIYVGFVSDIGVLPINHSIQKHTQGLVYLLFTSDNDKRIHPLIILK